MTTPFHLSDERILKKLIKISKVKECDHISVNLNQSCFKFKKV